MPRHLNKETESGLYLEKIIIQEVVWTHLRLKTIYNIWEDEEIPQIIAIYN